MGTTRLKTVYNSTQTSTLKSLAHSLKSKPPRIAVDNVSEENGGITNTHSSAVLPRNLQQAYNLKKKQKKMEDEESSDDPDFKLILE